jgi:SAM-dependent methyltransferase
MKELMYQQNLKRKILNSSLPVSIRKLIKPIYKTSKGSSDYWSSRPKEGDRGAGNYIKMDSTGRALVEEVSRRASNKEDKLLDLGCNIGRHLNALREKGFKNLYGVDLSYAAREACEEVFPELNDLADLTQGSFENYLLNTEDKFFDIIYTHGATVEHVTPVFPLVKHICRATKNYVIFGAVHLNGSTYPRFWQYEFEKHGFYLKKLLQPEQEWASDSKTNRPMALVVFERSKD